jgi:plastocyanin
MARVHEVAALTALAGLLAGCVSDRPTTAPDLPPTGVQVTIENFAVQPAQLTVPAGTPVTWTNRDDVSHTVTADDGSTFGSGAFGRGGSFTFTAGAPGTYTYFCQIHPFMKGTLTVTP